MNTPPDQPDWNIIAEKFDVWLPHLAPVGETLLTALHARHGDHILDLASGTGEPALSLARRHGGAITITGIDAAAGMVKVAQAKVIQENLVNVAFQAMRAEDLSFADHSFDRILCRFGIMLFDDPLQGLREAYRTLKPGGLLAMTVWADPETMTTMYWIYHALKQFLPDHKLPALPKATSLGCPGVLDTLLQNAGFHDHIITTHTFHYRFPSFESYWALVEASDILKIQFDACPHSNSIRSSGKSATVPPVAFIMAG